MQKDKIHAAIVLALRQVIAAHGPITKTRIGSAAKRIEGELKKAEILRIRGANLEIYHG
jgi:hypothetical protein